MATRSSGAGSRPKAGRSGRGLKRAAADRATRAEADEITMRAARLGITVDRVLREYARIAFADLRHLIERGADGRLVVKDPDRLSAADIAAISEIVEAAGGSYRIKLYDKKAALDAIARHLGMFPAARRRREEDASSDPAEDAREALARHLARLAAGGGEE